MNILIVLSMLLTISSIESFTIRPPLVTWPPPVTSRPPPPPGTLTYTIHIGGTVVNPSVNIGGNGKPTGVGIGISFPIGKRV
jgi:hypothetical protein